MAETSGLLNRRTGNSRTEGSNPSVSAKRCSSLRNSRRTAPALRRSELPEAVLRLILSALTGAWDMAWCIGRAEAMGDPIAARRKALAKLRGLVELDDPESVVVPILIDAILMVESYRGARHQISFLPELTKSVDDLLRELTIVEKATAWAAE